MENLTFHPLTPNRWDDLEKLFGPNGASSGCWCMYWRQTRREFDDHHGEDNRQSFREIVESGVIPGILVYAEDEPAGWCSIAPREQFPSLDRSHVLKRIDDAPVWSIVCFFAAKDNRRKGIIQELIRAGVDYARSQGATTVEAYPTRPRGKRLQAVSVYMGVPEVFRKAGFEEVSQPSESKVIMRYILK